jgi:hypothetical protein
VIKRRVPPSTDAVLAVVLVLECVGALGMALHAGQGLETVGAALAMGAAVLFAVRRERRAAYVVAGWFVTAAVLKMVTSTEPNSSLALVSQAARYGVALAVAQPRLAVPILRIAASLTFIGHGIQALTLQPIFVAYLQHTGGLVALHVSDGAAATMLRVIGTVDLVVALALLGRGPRPLTAGYMSVWGTITALARMVYAGPAGLGETLIRAANAGAPLALWLGWRAGEPAPTSSSSEP